MLFKGRSHPPLLQVEGHSRIYSKWLKRDVMLDFFLPAAYPLTKKKFPFLILNDGQDADALRLKRTLSRLTQQEQISEILVCAIYAGDRMQEYGVAGHPDFKKRGSKARQYSRFITGELLPLMVSNFRVDLNSGCNAIAGFSLGGLSAFDLAWNNPQWFQRAGIFSGSLWWRSVGYGEGYNEGKHRIAHAMVRSDAAAKKNLKLWFEAGTLDETADRNGNGVIDAIDDTLDLICELAAKGYRPYDEVVYTEMKNGRHNQQTWARALPRFMKWCFGNEG